MHLLFYLNLDLSEVILVYGLHVEMMQSRWGNFSGHVAFA